MTRTRLLLVTAAILLLPVLASQAVLAFPQPLFAWHAERGRLQLSSDRPFDAARADAVLADIERRIAAGPLPPGSNTHRIFVANAAWRRRLTFLWNGGAAGVNYYPLHNVFIRAADIDADRVLRSAGPVPPPRTLAYYAAHEIGHSLIGERIGAIANQRLPRWIREGVADTIGFGGEVDIDGLTRRLIAGDRELDPQLSGFYTRYRLLVAFFLQREGWSIDRLLASNMPQEEAEQRLLAAASHAGRLSQQVGEFRVPVDVVRNEGTARHDLEALRAHAVQHAAHHLRADAAAAQGGRHFGMREGHYAVREPIEGERVAALDVEFEAVVRCVMTDGWHGTALLLGLHVAHSARNCIRGMADSPKSDALKSGRNSAPEPSMKNIAYLLGALLIVVGAIYLLVPADQLPWFLPGADPTLPRIRVRRGLIVGGAGIVLIALGWYYSRPHRF